jgi:hypothetical protein
MFLHLAAVDFELKVPFLAPQIGGRLSKGWYCIFFAKYQ